MPSLEKEAYRLRSLIDDADAIIVGIGSGMSSAAGFNHYNRAGMARAGMADWQQAFGFKSLFDGFYHLYPSLEQQWAYYVRYIDFMLREPASQPYLDLRSLIGHKDYFILSPMWTPRSRRRFLPRGPATIREASRTFSASSHAATSSSTRVPTSSACSRAWRGSRSAARMSPDARTAAGSLCRGCATTRFCRVWHGARASDDASASCTSAVAAACCCWSLAWAK